jgi:fatty acid desaturase
MAQDELDFLRSGISRRDPLLAKLSDHRRRRLFVTLWLLVAAAVLALVLIAARNLLSEGFAGDGSAFRSALAWLASVPLGVWLVAVALLVVFLAPVVLSGLRSDITRRRNRRRLLHYEQEQTRRWEAHRRH